MSSTVWPGSVFPPPTSSNPTRNGGTASPPADTSTRVPSSTTRTQQDELFDIINGSDVVPPPYPNA